MYGVLKCSRLFGFCRLFWFVCLCVCLCVHACVRIFVDYLGI